MSRATWTRAPSVACGAARPRAIVDFGQADRGPTHPGQGGARELPRDSGAIALGWELPRPQAPGARARRRAARRKTLHTAPAALLQDTLQAGLAGLDQQSPAAGHDAQQLVELPLDGREVRIDIGVIVFEGDQQHRARPGV